ncbi:gamma-glutamyl-gamma-aminobutyrate hydrolase family protein [Bdellovibrio sp. HCB-110]|uniref:gamma-glutamyl-gamma-aminobutyrate hydrolase family protein n=1 Tax=Bdellovibrio sp. HCB-110 TaxID=3391182 RepID=UPI0039B5D42F
MRTSLWALLFLLFFFTTTTWAAESLRLYEWSPGTTLAPLILPVRASETPEVAAQRYLKELSKNPELMELFEGRLPDLPLRGFKPLNENSREARALMISNLPKDYAKNSQRVINFKKIFAQARHSSYILPMNTNLGLSQSETRELFQQISERFPLMVAMGGDDVDPRLYKQENFHSRNTIPARDQFEVELIKSYVAQEKGFLFGVCRGSQISSVALGYKLIQDVPFHIGNDVSHSNDWHDIEVKDTKNNILKSLANASGKMHVNSLHHQSVIFKEGGMLQIAARSHDGVTEATEFKNGRGLLLQFHPELMNNELGSKILWNVVVQKNRVMPRSCSKIFNF